MKRFRLPSGVSRESVWRALRDEFRENPRVRKIPARVVAATIALLSGRRRGEIARLRRENIDRKKKEIARHIEKKRGMWVVKIPFGPQLESILRRIRSVQGKPREGRVVGGNPRSWSVVFKRWAKRHGRNELRFHDLRHLFALHALERGVPLPALRKILQHSNLSITSIYLEMHMRDLVDYVLRMCRFL